VPRNTITFTNTWAQFEGPNLYQAREVLSYQQKGYTYSRAFKLGVWDGIVHLIKAKGRFPAGLVPWLVERLAAEGIDVEVVDTRPEPLPRDTRLSELHTNVELREHQQDAVSQALTGERGVVWHPTAAGKTEIFIELTRRIGRPGLVLVHRKDLMYQAAERFMKTLDLGESMKDFADQDVIGLIGDGEWQPRVITVATFQTLYMRLKQGLHEVEHWLREEIGQVHVDEAQHLPARSYEKVMANLWAARWRLGYSATPYKEGDPETFFKVASWLGPTVHRATAGELAERGYLVPADVFLIQMEPRPRNYRTWPEAVQEGIVEHATRNQMITELAQHLAQTGSGPVVILVERLAHGERLARTLNAPFIAGNASTSARRAAWASLKDGSCNVLVASKIADEGLDIPPLAFLIMAGGGKAPHLTVQRVGRGLRASEGKDRLFVFDFLDQGKWLGKHAKRRQQTYSEQPAYSVSVVDYKEVTNP
jgi:superfamily II DNA or RNA helicase